MERIAGTNQVKLNAEEKFHGIDLRQNAVIYEGPCILRVDVIEGDVIKVQGPGIAGARFFTGPLENLVKPQ